VTASGDPVGAGKLAFLPRPDPLGETRNGWLANPKKLRQRL